MSKTTFRRTYLNLEAVCKFLDEHLKSVSDKDLFLSAFATFFLIEKPLFDNRAHKSNSIQTFYANHYLRETLKMNVLPSFDNLFAYCKSDTFCSDIYMIYKSLHINLDQQEDSISVEIQSKCIEISANTLAPPKELDKLFEHLVSRLSISHGKYSITNHETPPEVLFEKLETDGFYVLNDFLTSDALKKIKTITEIIALSEEQKGTAYLYGESGVNQRIYNLISKHEIYVDLISHPYLMDVCDRVFDRPTLHEKFGVNSMTAHIVAPGAKAIPMHIDSVVPDPIPPWMIRFICILALDDFTVVNGATEFVKGSHKFLRRPNPEDTITHRAEIAECKAGSLIMFDGAVWHRSTSNSTENRRMGLMLSYAASYFMELCGEEEHLTIIPKHRIESFTPKMKQMIGYHRAIKKGAQDIDEKIYSKDLENL
jgi:hypothetical protein